MIMIPGSLLTGYPTPSEFSGIISFDDQSGNTSSIVTNSDMNESPGSPAENITDFQDSVILEDPEEPYWVYQTPLLVGDSALDSGIGSTNLSSPPTPTDVIYTSEEDGQEPLSPMENGSISETV